MKNILRLLIAGIVLVLLSVSIRAEIYVDSDLPLYETWEKSIVNSKSYSNKFRFDVIQLDAVFTSPTGTQFNVFGFYNGNGNGGQTGNVWTIRFMPDEIGTWSYVYSWSDGTSGGSGSFQVTARTNDDNHGHVHRDPNNQRYLIYDDGTAHYCYGGCWLDSDSFSSSSERSNTKAYIDYFAQTEHNGLKFGEIAMFPMNNDRQTFDLSWFHNMEEILEYGIEKGIYFQVGLFDTWGRCATSKSICTDSDDQLLDPWHATYMDETKYYIKYMIARLASYPTVYWELGNEMEHSPNSGSAFVSLSNQYYIPWISQYDPYDLAIGLSEEVWESADIDIGFLHQTGSLPSTSWSKPTIMNELVSGGVTGASLWRDETIRNSDDRLSYRRTFWRMFTYGGSGSFEATWLHNLDSLNSAVRNVMLDHQRLRNFIEDLPVHINEMDTDTNFVSSGPGDYRTRREAGEAYVTYFLLSPGQSTSSGTVSVNLPSGDYEATWYDTKDGSYTTPTTISGGSGTTQISHPSFTEDIVLRILQSSMFDDTPPSIPQNLDATTISDSQIDISWQASSDSESGVSYYKIFRNNNEIDQSAITSYSDIGLNEGTTYSYEVLAVNGAGLESGRSNSDSATTSSDATPPTIISVSAISSTKVKIIFSEPVEQSSATTISNYNINGISIISASLDVDLKTLTLTTASHSGGVTYTLTVNNVRDRASSPNNIAPNTQKTYTFSTRVIISNLNVATGKDYEVVEEGLQVGALVYIDRSYTFSSIPSYLEGDTYIKTANEDKFNQGEDFLSFDVNNDASVYVAHDDSIGNKPSWLLTFTDSGDNVVTTDTTLNIFEKDFSAGTITLGGNEGGSSNSMYLVIVVEQGFVPDYKYATIKTSIPPTIDGDISEFDSADAITLTEPTSGITGTYKILWDNAALYIAAQVSDAQLAAAYTERDGRVWRDDAVELFFDTLNDKGASRQPDDYKFFVNVLNVHTDSNGEDRTWNATYISGVTASGTVNQIGDTDTGYTIEVAIPWSEWTGSPVHGDMWGFDIALRERNDSGESLHAIWANTDGDSNNNPDGWGEMLFTVRTDTSRDGCVSMPELIPFIDSWKYDSTAYPMREMMEAVSLYYNPGAWCR